MSTCPECRLEVTRRVDGCCHHCGTPIEKYKGYWYRAGTGSPAVAIIKHFEKLVSQQLSRAANKPVKFVIPTVIARYKRELVSAERLLSMADHDLDLVLETITTLFTHYRFKRKTYTTLLWLDDDFILALAITRAVVDARKKSAAHESSLVQSVSSREDIFA